MKSRTRPPLQSLAKWDTVKGETPTTGGDAMTPHAYDHRGASHESGGTGYRASAAPGKRPWLAEMYSGSIIPPALEEDV
jgi:hypothetical protein